MISLTSTQIQANIMNAPQPKIVREGRWSRAVPIKHPDSIKLPNPFEKCKPFKPSYEKDVAVNINSLLNWDYYRIWKEEHDIYITDRNSKVTPPKKNFPIYRKPIKVPDEPKKPMPSKKYANVKSKVFNF